MIFGRIIEFFKVLHGFSRKGEGTTRIGLKHVFVVLDQLHPNGNLLCIFKVERFAGVRFWQMNQPGSEPRQLPGGLSKDGVVSARS